MPSDRTPMDFAGASLGEHRHVCAFFDTPEDEYRVMTPFVRDGLAHGDRAIHFVAEDRDDHISRLRRGGIDVESARTRRQLEILPSEEVYTPEGTFDGVRMLARIQSILSEARPLGFGLTRIWAHAEFVGAHPASAHAFIEYESRLNDLLSTYADPVICVYDLDKTSAGMAYDVLRTHPFVIIGQVLQQNPYYVPPSQLLTELAQRANHSWSSTADPIDTR
jgi:hypothetical protein